MTQPLSMVPSRKDDHTTVLYETPGASARSVVPVQEKGGPFDATTDTVTTDPVTTDPAHMDALISQVIEHHVRWQARPFLGAGEFAQATGLHRDTVADLIKRRQIPAVRIGGRMYVPTRQFLRWLEANTRYPAGYTPGEYGTQEAEREAPEPSYIVARRRQGWRAGTYKK